MAKWGYYLALTLVMITWGLNVIATKVLVDAFPPIMMTALRVFAASLFIFAYLFMSGKLHLPSKSQFKLIITAGTFNVVGHLTLLAIGLQHTSAANGGIILGLGPILTSLLSVKLMNHRLSIYQWVGLVLGFSGVFLVVINGGDSLSAISIGDPIIFLSILSQAISFILIKKGADKMDAISLTGWMMMYGSIIILVLALMIEPQGLTTMMQQEAMIWMIFFASAFIPSGIGQMVYNRSVQHLGPAETSVFLNFNPLFSLIGAVLLPNEQIELIHLFGFVLIVLGVLLGSRLIEMLFHRGDPVRVQQKITNSH